MSAQRPNLTPVLGYPTSVWYPTIHNISSISQSDPCVITTETPHGYQDGIIIRVWLPNPSMGMQPLNGSLFQATILSATQLSIPVDTRTYDPFTAIVSQPAQVLPSGEISTTLENTVQNVTVVPPNAPLG